MYVISVKIQITIAHAVLVLKDTFAPGFASIQSILDSIDFFGKLRDKSGLIFKLLHLYVIFELILCCIHIL